MLSTLANLKLVVTIFIADALRIIADARAACSRMQRLLEKKHILTCKMAHKDKALSLGGRRNRSEFVRIESFRNGKPALISARKLEAISQHTSPTVILENVSCSWSQMSEFPALQNVSLDATNGHFVGITGPVGSGKTTLLMSMLGEIPISSGRISCIGKMAYVSQMPWVYSGTLRENIVFGRHFVEEKYSKVIQVCDLEKDIERFTKGDLTEIGQRGVILSGGQRARVSLARAIYSDADIYLLDDPLSAVDAKVGKHLFEKCIKEFLGGQIRILVTHQLQFLKQVDKIVVLQNGSVMCQGTYIRILENNKRIFSSPSEAKEDFSWEKGDQQMITVFSEDTYESIAAAKAERERVDLKDEEEDRMIGSVKWWLYWKYFRAALPKTLIASLAVFFAVVQGK